MPSSSCSFFLSLILHNPSLVPFSSLSQDYNVRGVACVTHAAMELATFSDIEFVGIAADRHVVLKPTRRERRDSCEGSSTISLMSGGSEIERSVDAVTAHENYPTDMSLVLTGTTRAWAHLLSTSARSTLWARRPHPPSW